jgi:glycosyltransferase involved in cell wall biosynthesis
MSERKKILYFSNIIAPYNIEYFNGLYKELKGSIYFYFDNSSESNRQWKIQQQQLLFEYKIENSWNVEKESKVSNATTLSRTIYFPFSVVKRIFQQRPDVVLSIEFGIRSLLCLTAAKIAGANFLIVSDVTIGSEKTVGRGRQLLRKLIARFSDGAVARSQHAKLYLERLGMSSPTIHVAPYAVSMVNPSEEIIKPDTERFNLLYAGHFQHLKGLDLLLAALVQLDASAKNKLVLQLAGGTKEELLMAFPDALNMGIEISILGFLNQEELAGWYKRANAFVLPSRQDTWGLVINEAVQQGCPVIISTYAGAADELILHKDSGLIVDPLNTTEFAQSLEFAITHPEELARYAEKATANLRFYSYDQAVGATIKAISSVSKSIKPQNVHA